MYIYRAVGHPEGAGGNAWFRIDGDRIYRAVGHPEGAGGNAWFHIGK
jgi:hypothetical protein